MNTIIKEIEPRISQNLTDIILSLTILEDKFSITTKDEHPITFTLSQGNQINPNYDEFNLNIKFDVHGNIDYMYKDFMIPCKRTKSIFTTKPLMNITELRQKSNAPGLVNFDYGLSFSKKEQNLEDIANIMTGIIDYNNTFIKYHNNFLKEAQEINTHWKEPTEEKTKKDLRSNITKIGHARVINVPFLINNDLVFLVVDYNVPENLILPQANYMFPEARLGNFFRKSFPEPEVYLRGELLNIPPPALRGKFLQEENTIRKLYQMEFSQNSNYNQINTTMEQANKYVTDFINIHYDVMKKFGKKRK